MRYRVDYYLRCVSQADADTVSTRVASDIQARTDFEYAHGPAVYQDADSHMLWMATGGGWLTTEAGARQLHQAIDQRMKAGPVANRIVAGSVVELHPCNNEDRAACDPLTIEYFVKT